MYIDKKYVYKILYLAARMIFKYKTNFFYLVNNVIEKKNKAQNSLKNVFFIFFGIKNSPKKS